MKRSLIILIITVCATTAAAYGQYDPESGDVALDRDTYNFREFKEEHWNDFEIRKPEQAERKMLRNKLAEERERKYGTRVETSRTVDSNRARSSYSVGGAPRNSGGWDKYPSRRSNYDPERDRRRIERAIAEADALHAAQLAAQQHVFNAISRGQRFNPDDFAALYNRFAGNRGLSFDPSADTVDFKPRPTDGLIPEEEDETALDIYVIISKYEEDPDSLSAEEYDYYIAYLDLMIMADDYVAQEEALKQSQSDGSAEDHKEI